MDEAEDLGVDMLSVLALDESYLNLSHDSSVVFEDCNWLVGGGEASLILISLLVVWSQTASLVAAWKARSSEWLVEVRRYQLLTDFQHISALLWRNK